MQRTNLLKIFPKRKLTLRQKEALYGRLFILPWLIGLVIFFIIPFINSIYYTFHKIRLGDNGLEFEFIGWENYIYAFTKDPDYLKNLTSSITNMLYEVPIVIIFSVFVCIFVKR